MGAVRTIESQQTVGSKPLLYVEDNAINSKVVRYGMRGYYDVTVAMNAREACDQLRAQQGEFAAILMDIELQGSELDGIQLTRLFRGLLQADEIPDYVHDLMVVDIPIIIVSAYLERYSQEFLTRAGASACLSKPVNLPRLRDLLTAIG